MVTFVPAFLTPEVSEWTQPQATGEEARLKATVPVQHRAGRSRAGKLGGAPIRAPPVDVGAVADHIDHVARVAGHRPCRASAAISTASLHRRRARRRRGLSAAVRRADPPRLERRQSRQARRRQHASRDAPGRSGRRSDARTSRRWSSSSRPMSEPPPNPPLRAAITPVTPLQQNCTLAVVHGDDARRLRRSRRRPPAAQGGGRAGRA